MLAPMQNKRTRPEPKPKPYGDRKKSRRDHGNNRHAPWEHE